MGAIRDECRDRENRMLLEDRESRTALTSKGAKPEQRLPQNPRLSASATMRANSCLRVETLVCVTWS
ncbi:hypothetical protein I79_002397 [Cricetulus griseus]|uniref:Uncharacterized protein n=1 Tax=Cricetulus griseus TaxID=10029 RepID=G3GXA7_CRIGR|nr:hypothetical protein I79_002397 [Cricetulus griseus]